jgi:hypothetical protein
MPQGELTTFQASPKDSNLDAVLSFEINTESTEDMDSGQLAFQASHDRMTPEELLAIVRKRLAEIKADRNQINSATKSPQHPESSLQHPSSDDPIHISPRTKEALIDRFILEEPKISKPKAAFFNPSDSAVRSNFDDDEIVSETLAKLYAAQGNIPKAVHIYQKLSLLNQEKSRYFAAQIENLKS